MKHPKKKSTLPLAGTKKNTDKPTRQGQPLHEIIFGVMQLHKDNPELIREMDMLYKDAYRNSPYPHTKAKKKLYDDFMRGLK